MKIRNGFVSNSSSSSFIIFIEDDIKTLDDFMKLCERNSLCLDDGWMDKLTCDYFDDDPEIKSITNREALIKLWNDIQYSNHLITDKLTCDYFGDDPEIKSINNREALIKLWNDIQYSNHLITDKEEKQWINGYWKPQRVGGYCFEKYCEEYNTASEIAHWMTSNDEEYDKMKKELDEMANKWNKLLSKTIFKSFFAKEGGKIYQMVYSDNDSNLETQMEHGSLWDVVDCLVISQH